MEMFFMIFLVFCGMLFFMVCSVELVVLVKSVNDGYEIMYYLNNLGINMFSLDFIVDGFGLFLMYKLFSLNISSVIFFLMFINF